MATIYMSVETGFEKDPVSYRSSNRIARTLQQRGYDLHLIRPREYDLEGMSVMASYAFSRKDDMALEKKQGKHTPQGDVFIIYGDETSKSPGLNFAIRQYEFLKRLESMGNFKEFFNRPEAESRTLKTWFADMYEQGKFHGLPVAATYRAVSLEKISQLLKKHQELVLKPAFGCRSTGVRKIRDTRDLSVHEKANLDEIILQEVIPSHNTESRIAILDGEVLFSSIYLNFSAPWEKHTEYTAQEHKPSKQMTDAAMDVFAMTCLDFGGIDWVGDKINEVNGTGTGVIGKDSKGNITYDYSEHIVRHIERLAAQ